MKKIDLLASVGIEDNTTLDAEGNITIKREGLTVTIKKDDKDETVVETPTSVDIVDSEEETQAKEEAAEPIEPIPEEQLEELVTDIRQEGNIAQNDELEIAKEAIADLLSTLSVASTEAFDETTTQMMHTAIDSTYATLHTQPPSQVIAARTEDPESALAMAVESCQCLLDKITQVLDES